MAVIPYQIKENNSIGTHSFYCVAKTFSTLNFDDIADEVVESIGISPSVVRTVLERYTVVVTRNVQRGHRVKMGDLLTIYPQISCSVKDEVDEQGNVIKAATADMINVQQARASIGATISQGVQQSFAKSVSWKRVSEISDDAATSSTDPSDGDGNGGEGGGGSLPVTDRPGEGNE